MGHQLVVVQAHVRQQRLPVKPHFQTQAQCVGAEFPTLVGGLSLRLAIPMRVGIHVRLLLCESLERRYDDDTIVLAI